MKRKAVGCQTLETTGKQEAEDSSPQAPRSTDSEGPSSGETEQANGPFQVVEEDGSGEVKNPSHAPPRHYSCHHYDICLDLACALNWDSFSCNGCSEQIDESLLWRAHQARKRDQVARRLCMIPEIRSFCQEEDEDENKRLKKAV